MIDCPLFMSEAEKKKLKTCLFLNLHCVPLFFLLLIRREPKKCESFEMAAYQNTNKGMIWLVIP